MSIQPALQLVQGGPSRDDTWGNGRRHAVSLAYVGGLQEHADIAAPVLKDLDMPATMYVSSDEVLDYAIGWQRINAPTIEFGSAPFESANKEGELVNWPVQAIESEIRECNRFVRDFFGLPSMGISVKGNGEQEYYQSIRHVGHVLTQADGINDFSSDYFKLQSVPFAPFDSFRFESAKPTWTIIMVRELFGRTNQKVLGHRVMLEQLKRRSGELWLAPISQVVSELRLR